MNTLNAIDSLRGVSVKLNGDFIENSNGGFLTFKNEWGKGNAKAFKLFPGLEVVTFNITSKKRIILDNFYRATNCLHFIFCIEGSLIHSFENQLEGQAINRLQNVIIGSYKNKSSTIEIAKDVKVHFSIITVTDISNLSNELDNSSQLSALLTGVMKNIQGFEEYSYFGRISNNVTPFVETLINTNLSGLSNRLINEAAVFKILSLQYSEHSRDKENLEKINPLSKTDTLKVIQLSEYISQNLEKDISLKKLTSLSGLNQKKIQKGFQFFFDETVNKFISNLRILKAKELLETSDENISGIVYQIGLNSRSYFSKIFYKKYGLIPKEYRKYHYLTNPTFELSYCSRAQPNITSKNLRNILVSAKKNNAAANITGCLIYYNNTFFQILEGPKTEVLSLIKTIEKDVRNDNIEILYEGVKSGRTFKEWSMALVQDTFDMSPEELDSFEVLKVDFLPMTDIKNPIAMKYMWEKARNYLIVTQELDK